MNGMLFEKWMSEGSVSIPNMLLKHYKKIGLTDTECMLFIQLHVYIESGNYFPTPLELAERMTASYNEISSMLRSLIGRGLLGMDQYEDKEKGVYFEAYTLQPLWNQLMNSLKEEEQIQKESMKEKQEQNVFVLFEKEFGRPLSPMELETLKIWMDEDQQSPELILTALKESVLSGKLNFRYIDRILFEWKKNGIRSPEAAKMYGEKFRVRQLQKSGQHDVPRKDSGLKRPAYNWLES
ncbi:DnaD domain-containing protein [Fictibacillus nanhaiensis]|jgi:DNA replication protein|uniref:DnaD domain-containing protein n=1 Tax=Fictibacillus nanhaiensis TaxID=742169 RepID=UPI00203F1D64|nr:DnaD domain-containing protein [Fictibacillus nanhaiensis]MCM3730461.1 DnaD domain-containing protein [Fictibacillus nanhaiensis]